MPEDVYYLGVRNIQLTPIEEETLRFVCQAYPNRRIAQLREVTESAVERLLTRLRAKLGIKQLGCPARVELVNLVWRNAWNNADIIIEEIKE